LRQQVQDAIDNNPRTKSWAERFGWQVNPIALATGATLNVGNPQDSPSLRVFDSNIDPTYKAMKAELDGKTGITGPRDLPSHVRGTLATEAGRMPGMLPAYRVSGAMAKSGLISWKDYVGDYNPMEPQGSALAGDQEHWHKKPEERGKDDTIPKKGAGRDRLKRITKIFDKLASAARTQGDNGELLGKGPGSLAELARAADSWMKARLPKPDESPEAVEVAAARLRTELFTFMKTFRG
jgi:hypothetical protein